MKPAQWRLLTALDEGGSIKLEQSFHSQDKSTLIKKDGTELSLQINTPQSLLRSRWIYQSACRGNIFYYKLSPHGKEALHKANHPPGKHNGNYVCTECGDKREHNGSSNAPRHCRNCEEQNCMGKRA